MWIDRCRIRIGLMARDSYKTMIHGLSEKQKKISMAKKTAEPWYVYILRCADGSLYTGITNNVERRLETHRSGKGARFTRTRLPVEPVYRESCVSRAAALIREYAIKSFSRPQKDRLIAFGKAPEPGRVRKKKKKLHG